MFDKYTNSVKKISYLSLSIDDGHPADLKVADLLIKYGLKATFYIPARNPEHEMMPSSDIQNIARHFEVGGHTFNHKPLKDLPSSIIREEIFGGKKWLEDCVGDRVVSFCYPRGKFCKTAVQIVEEVGFLGARACLYNLNRFPTNPYLWGVSTHAYSHSMAIQVRHALIEGNIEGLWNYFSIFKATQDWQTHFLKAVHSVEQKGGVAHLYFHSWEIAEQKEWNKLENLFAMLSEKKHLVCVTNGELFRLHRKNSIMM